MTGPLSVLAPAVLATVVVQAPAVLTPSCLPPDAHIDDVTSRRFCDPIAAAGKGRLQGPTAYRLVYIPTFRRWKMVEAPGTERLDGPDDDHERYRLVPPAG